LITDTEENLEAVARAAKLAGARQFGANVLFLKPCAERVFPFLAEKFPQHLRRYEASYSAGAYLKGKYPERIREMVGQIRERVGIRARDMASVIPPPAPDAQMLLF
jgi:DNA repair photolyase